MPENGKMTTNGNDGALSPMEALMKVPEFDELCKLTIRSRDGISDEGEEKENKKVRMRLYSKVYAVFVRSRANCRDHETLRSCIYRRIKEIRRERAILALFETLRRRSYESAEERRKVVSQLTAHFPEEDEHLLDHLAHTPPQVLRREIRARL